MASISSLSTSIPYSHILLSSNSSSSSNLSPIQLQLPCVRQQRKMKLSAIAPSSKRRLIRPTKVMAVGEEEETPIPQAEAEASPQPATDQTVSVPISPSDVLTMFFQAEGSMTDAAIPAVAKTLEEVEGVTDLKVKVSEGIASVKLTKQTTLQATGVASGLVEKIQGSGFKLQTLYLSFQDEDDLS